MVRRQCSSWQGKRYLPFSAKVVGSQREFKSEELPFRWKGKEKTMYNLKSNGGGKKEELIGLNEKFLLKRLSEVENNSPFTTFSLRLHSSLGLLSSMQGRKTGLPPPPLTFTLCSDLSHTLSHSLSCSLSHTPHPTIRSTLQKSTFLSHYKAKTPSNNRTSTAFPKQLKKDGTFQDKSSDSQCCHVKIYGGNHADVIHAFQNPTLTHPPTDNLSSKHLLTQSIPFPKPIDVKLHPPTLTTFLQNTSRPPNKQPIIEDSYFIF